MSELSVFTLAYQMSVFFNLFDVCFPRYPMYLYTLYFLVSRDINERGRTLDTILNQYINTVKPAFEEFCQPTKKFADVIIPRGADNTGILP